MAKKKKSKTISATVGGKTVNIRSGSKAEAKYKGLGATFGAASAERSSYLKSRNSPEVQSVEDPLSYAENQGLDVPDKITKEEMPRVVAGLQQQATPQTQAAVAPQPGEVPYEQARQNLATGGLQGQQLATAQTELSRYYKGFQQAQASGVQAPQDAGAAANLVQQNLAPKPAETVAVDSFVQQDPIFTQIMDSFNEVFSTPKQSETLLGQYNKLVSSSGLDEINEEMVDTKRIIEGTEDDIRAEVTAAAGFATDSQVLAMASARNKTLIQNYNALADTRDSIERNINTSMQLAQEDKRIAREQMTQKMNLGFQLLEYRDKMQRNAQEGYKNVVNAIGYDGLYNALASDPYTLGIAERTLGLNPGSLQQIAAQIPATAEKLDTQVIDYGAGKALVNTQTGEVIKTYAGKPEGSGVAGGGAPEATGIVDAAGKPIKLTATQTDSLAGFDNTLAGAQKAQGLLAKGVKTGPWESAKLSTKKFFDKADPDQLDLEQTLGKIKADFMKSISGAAVSESEAKRLAKFLPEIGDQEGVIKVKLKNLIEESKKSKANLLKTLGASGGASNVVVGPDGNEYEIID